MKYTLIILLTFLSFGVKAQTNFDSLFKAGKIITHGMGTHQYDTIQVWRLCTDTIPPYGILDGPHRWVSSMKLFEVREHTFDSDKCPMPSGGGFKNATWAGCWIHKEYLDSDKKPLSKNIIVWQTK